MPWIVTRKFGCAGLGECPDEFFGLARFSGDRIPGIVVHLAHVHAGHLTHHLAMLSLLRSIGDHELVRLFTLVDENEADCLSLLELEFMNIEGDFGRFDCDGADDFLGVAWLTAFGRLRFVMSYTVDSRARIISKGGDGEHNGASRCGGDDKRTD